jgi:diguanylate cyclase
VRGVATMTVMATPEERGRANGVFYLAGAAVAAFALVDPGAQRAPLLAVAAAAALVGLLSLLLRPHFTPLVTHVVVALAAALVGVAVVLGNGGIASVMIMADYLLVAIFMALLGSTRAIVAHTAWIAVTMGAASMVLWPLPTAAAVTAAFLTVCGTITAVSALLARQLRLSATTDPLTGLANRGGFDTALDAAVATVARTGEALSLVLMDLDKFKEVNDRGGHAAGDELLRTAALRWTAELRDRDTLARLGGDEFAVVMPGADRDAAAQVAARLAQATPRVSCSVGIATLEGDQSSDALLAAADQDLYDAKRRGPSAAPTPREVEATGPRPRTSDPAR